MPQVVIRLEELSKHFDKVKAVDGVNLDIFKGEIFGLLGPNGAGKTTILRMLSGLARPTNGKAQVAGFDPVGRLDTSGGIRSRWAGSIRLLHDWILGVGSG